LESHIRGIEIGDGFIRTHRSYGLEIFVKA